MSCPCIPGMQINWMINEIYSGTCLNLISLGPTFVYRIDSCLVYSGQNNKYFLHVDLVYSSVYKYTGLRFIQGLG